jgi:tetratricopeptide (TPR) repeat protein
MHARTAQRLLIVGWDAADWILVNRLFAAGKMPVLRRLVEAGCRADLGTLEPRLSPLLWSSIATGKTADKHGILNFVEPEPSGGGVRVSTSTSRKTKALWNILSQNGLETRVVGWYASHPAELIRGSVVTNLLQEGEPGLETASWPLMPGTVHPDSLADSVAAARQRVRGLPRETLRTLLPKVDEIGLGDARVQMLMKLMAYATSIEGAMLASLRAGDRWDAAMVFFDAIDTMGHNFMQYVAPKMAHVSEREQRLFGGVMDRVYEWHDASLGRILEAAGEGTTVILLSDHGFHCDHLRPNLSDLPPERRMELEASWHRPHGVLVMSGPGVQRGAEIASPTILDVAPTALALLGLPAGADFDGRVLSEALSTSPPAPIPSWDAVDGDAGLHPADLRMDPLEAADALQQLIDLGYLAAMPEDQQARVDLVCRESTFNLGMTLMMRRRPAEAVPHFERLVAAKPGEQRYALGLGSCLAGAGRFREAIVCADGYLLQDPACIDMQLLRATALSLAGDDAAAGAQIDAVAMAVASHPELAVSLAGCYSACGRHADAYRQFEAARKRNPRDPVAHLGLARSQLALGAFEDAGGHALDALEITQALPEGHLILGAALTWYGDLENARKSLEFALKFDPGQLDAHRWLALVAEKSGDAAQAKASRAEAARLAATVTERPREAPFGPSAFAKRNNLAAT